MASRFVLLPSNAEQLLDGLPTPTIVNGRPVLALDGANNKQYSWTVRLPDGWKTVQPPRAYATYSMAIAGTGTVDLDAAVEAVTDGDALDLHNADSFAAWNSTDGTAVPETPGHIDVIEITLTNHDGSTKGDYCRFRLQRDAANDTAPGDLYLYHLEIQDSA